jgi:antitoxin MazE
MQACVMRWRGELYVKVPRELVELAGLTEGSQVEVIVNESGAAASPARRQYRLQDLLQGMSRASMRRAFDWDAD